MKPSLLVLMPFLIGCPAFAGEIGSIHAVQTSLTVDSLGVVNERLPSSVSMSGTNIAVNSLPNLAAGTAGTGIDTTAASLGSGDPPSPIVVEGASFDYNQAAFAGSSASSMMPELSDGTGESNDFPIGTLMTLGAADRQTVTNGGIAGSLAATNLPTGLATITAGGPGTTAILLRSNTLTVFP